MTTTTRWQNVIYEKTYFTPWSHFLLKPILPDTNGASLASFRSVLIYYCLLVCVFIFKTGFLKAAHNWGFFFYSVWQSLLFYLEMWKPFVFNVTIKFTVLRFSTWPIWSSSFILQLCLLLRFFLGGGREGGTRSQVAQQVNSHIDEATLELLILLFSNAQNYTYVWLGLSFYTVHFVSDNDLMEIPVWFEGL